MQLWRQRQREREMAGMKIVMATNACLLRNKILLHGFHGSLPLVISLNHSIQKHKLVHYSSSRRRSDSKSKTKFRVKQKGKQISPATIEGEEETMDHEAITSTKLTALVSVRNNEKPFANEMVDNFLSIFIPQNHSKGVVVLQLVSTELDPSKNDLSNSSFYFAKSPDSFTPVGSKYSKNLISLGSKKWGVGIINLCESKQKCYLKRHIARVLNCGPRYHSFRSLQTASLSHIWSHVSIIFHNIKNRNITARPQFKTLHIAMVSRRHSILKMITVDMFLFVILFFYNILVAILFSL